MRVSACLSINNNKGNEDIRMLKLVLSAFAVFGFWIGMATYVPSSHHTAFITPVINVAVSYLFCGACLVLALSLGMVKLGKGK